LKKAFLFLFLYSSLLFSSENTKYGKMLLIYVEMKNCPWCMKMDREVFDNSDNLQRLEKSYFVKRLTKESAEIPTYIKPKYFPSTYILSSDGEKIIDELPGYMKAGDYLDYLKTLYEVENP
jgi:thioredoxin-related protein